MMLPRHQRYDRHHLARNERILIRAGHYLWKQFKAVKPDKPDERVALQAALELVWEAKRQVRAELKVERAAEAVKVRERLRPSARQAVSA